MNVVKERNSLLSINSIDFLEANIRKTAVQLYKLLGIILYLDNVGTKVFYHATSHEFSVNSLTYQQFLTYNCLDLTFQQKAILHQE